MKLLRMQPSALLAALLFFAAAVSPVVPARVQVAPAPAAANQAPCPTALRPPANVAPKKVDYTELWTTVNNGLTEVRAAADQATKAWVQTIQAQPVTAQTQMARNLVTAESDRQLGVEKAREGTIIDREVASSQATHSANAQQINETAAEWGRSRAQNVIASMTQPTTEAFQRDGVAFEAMKRDTVWFISAGEQVAKKAQDMAAAVNRSGHGSAIFHGTLPGHAEEVVTESRQLQGQAMQEQRLAGLAESVSKDVQTMARATLQDASNAETTANRALATAQQNARDLSVLRERVIRATQRATAASRMGEVGAPPLSAED